MLYVISRKNNLPIEDEHKKKESIRLIEKRLDYLRNQETFESLRLKKELSKLKNDRER